MAAGIAVVENVALIKRLKNLMDDLRLPTEITEAPHFWSQYGPVPFPKSGIKIPRRRADDSIVCPHCAGLSSKPLNRRTHSMVSESK